MSFSSFSYQNQEKKILYKSQYLNLNLQGKNKEPLKNPRIIIMQAH
jgi:hypothetical protein